MSANYPQRYAAALREWRAGKGMTLRELAAWLKEREGGRAPSETTLSQLENGYRLPTAKWRPVLARAGFVPPARTPLPVLGLARYA